LTRLSKATSGVLTSAREAATEFGHATWSTHHILLALTRLGGTDSGGSALSELGVGEADVRASIERYFPPDSGAGHSEPHAALVVHELMTHAHWLAAYRRSQVVETEDLLLALLWDQDSISAQALGELGVSFEDAYRTLTGDEAPPEIRPAPSKRGDYGEAVYVSKNEMEVVLRRLHEFLPPKATYAFNFDDKQAWFWAEKDVNLGKAIEEVLTAD
jgi:ATP-dependent Clp protease ATP-binding subunit ClpC